MQFWSIEREKKCSYFHHGIPVRNDWAPECLVIGSAALCCDSLLSIGMNGNHLLVQEKIEGYTLRHHCSVLSQ